MNLRAGVIAVAVVLLVSLTGVAMAWFGVLGTGTGTAVTRVPTTSAVTLAPGTATGTLYPSGTAIGTVSVTATNSDDAAVRIGTLAIDTTQGTNGFAFDAAHAGCTASSLTFTSQTNGGDGWVVPGNDSLTITLPSSLTMATSAPNTCQGAEITVYLRITA